MLSWVLEPGSYVVGSNPLVAVVEIGTQKTGVASWEYGLKGNVFTGNFGVDLIVRNLYRAREVRKVYVVGREDVPLFKPMESLVKLHANGVDGRGRVIGATGYKPFVKRASREAIEHFRSLDLVVVDDLRSGEVEPIQRDDIVVRYLKNSVERFDFPLNVNVGVEANNLFDLWVKVVNLVFFWGKEVSSQRGGVREVLNLRSVLTAPMLGEKFFEFFDKEDMDSYVANSFLNPVDPGAGTYTYGNRMIVHGKLWDVVEYLTGHLETRRALVALWNPVVDVGGQEDVPCLTQVQFIVRGGKLYVFAYFRSHDVVKAYPENLYGLLTLVNTVAERLNVGFGLLTVHSVSAHIYTSDYDKVRELLHPRARRVNAPKPFKPDQAGNFIITPSGSEIRVELRDQSNNTVFTLTGDNAESLSSAIAELFQHLRPEHYLYLGRELQRAELHVKGVLNEYVQG